MPVIKTVYVATQRDHPDHAGWDPSYEVWQFCLTLQDKSELTNSLDRYNSLFRKIIRYPKDHHNLVRLDIWCREQLLSSFPVSHPQFLMRGYDVKLLRLLNQAATTAIRSNPFEPFQHNKFDFMFDGISKTVCENILRPAYRLIRDWHERRAGFAYLFMSDIFSDRNGSSGLVVAVSDHGEVLPIPLGAMQTQQNVQVLIDGVVGFDYSQSVTQVRVMSHPRVDDYGALYIDRKHTISNANLINPKGRRGISWQLISNNSEPIIDVNTVPDFEKYDDFSKRKAIMVEWLSQVMLSSPHKKTLVRDHVADQYGEVLGIFSEDPRRSFQSIWKRAILKLEAQYPDHVWSKAGRPRGKLGV